MICRRTEIIVGIGSQQCISVFKVLYYGLVCMKAVKTAK